jgi:hypothetical protein
MCNHPYKGIHAAANSKYKTVSDLEDTKVVISVKDLDHQWPT